MNDMMTTNSNTEPTMTSLEFVVFINNHRKESDPIGYVELLHKNLLAKVPEVLGEAVAKSLAAASPYEVNGAKRERPIYVFPKREACLMAMSYSYELQAKVYDHMTALEERVRRPLAPTTLLDALKLALAQEERLLAQDTTIKQMTSDFDNLREEVKELKPYKERMDQFHNQPDGVNYSVKEAAHLLKTPERKLFKFLLDDGITYAKAGRYLPYARFVNAGHCTTHAPNVPGNDVRIAVRFTPTGVTWLGTRLAAHKERERKMPNVISELFGDDKK